MNVFWMRSRARLQRLSSNMPPFIRHCTILAAVTENSENVFPTHLEWGFLKYGKIVLIAIQLR